MFNFIINKIFKYCKTVIDIFFCDFKAEISNTNRIWCNLDFSSLFIEPRKYSFVESLIKKNNHTCLCNNAEPELMWYGHYWSLVRYANLNQIKLNNISGDHGNIFWDYTIDEDFISKNKKNILLTFSYKRKRNLESYGLKAIAIGPYIHYAQDFNGSINKINKMKDTFGKFLLHFPEFRSHNKWDQSIDILLTEHKKCVFDIKQMIDQGVVDKAIICIRAIDLDWAANYIEIYNNNDFIFACCGNVNNPLYLDHLRYLIQLCHISTSNEVSTALGYSYYFNKKHFIIGDADFHIRTNRVFELPESNLIRSSHLIENNDMNVDIIDSSKYNVISNLWGFNNLKKNCEIRDILLNKYYYS